MRAGHRYGSQEKWVLHATIDWGSCQLYFGLDLHSEILKSHLEVAHKHRSRLSDLNAVYYFSLGRITWRGNWVWRLWCERSNRDLWTWRRDGATLSKIEDSGLEFFKDWWDRNWNPSGSICLSSSWDIYLSSTDSSLSFLRFSVSLCWSTDLALGLRNDRKNMLCPCWRRGSFWWPAMIDCDTNHVPTRSIEVTRSILWHFSEQTIAVDISLSSSSLTSPLLSHAIILASASATKRRA